MEFKGQVGQDKWVCEKLNHKRNGYVIDREDILCGGLAFEDWYVNKKLL